MFQVDAFADRIFGGNPAAVLVIDQWLPEAVMLAIAQENNLAETAFAKQRPDGSWDLRWLSPAHEVDFCGHATLATAQVLVSQGWAPSPISFHTRIGALCVSSVEDGYLLDLPCLPPQALAELPTEIAGIFPDPPVQIFQNFENIFADLGSSDAVRRFVPDLAATQLLGSVGLVVTGRGVAGE
jgi:predicted PhzF superfamily epimerase YddE/YHI9